MVSLNYPLHFGMRRFKCSRRLRIADWRLETEDKQVRSWLRSRRDQIRRPVSLPQTSLFRLQTIVVKVNVMMGRWVSVRWKSESERNIEKYFDITDEKEIEIEIRIKIKSDRKRVVALGLTKGGKLRIGGVSVAYSV